VIVLILGSGFLALLLECRLDGIADSLLPILLLTHHMPPCQLIFLQELAKAGQDASMSPLGAEAFGHYSRRGFRGRDAGIIGVVEPGLEAILGPVLPAEAE
jgi:hypothetical protein